MDFWKFLKWISPDFLCDHHKEKKENWPNGDEDQGNKKVFVGKPKAEKYDGA